MYIRSYFDKDNTIILNSTTNTGRNPVAELFYGGESESHSYSRHIFYFGLEQLQAYYNDGYLGDLSNVRHTIKMTNTSTFDTKLLGQKNCDDKIRACSYDLILFKINEPWDEGVGFDFDCEDCSNCSPNCGSYSECPSNWFNSQGISTWSTQGIYSGSSSAVTITTQHFDLGDENLCMDVTDVINDMITGGSINYGFGIAFKSNIESLETSNYFYTGFFTRQTQTYFEPFLETVYSGTIRDDRSKFYMDKTNQLCLYVNTGGEPTNLDNIPSQVLILDPNDTTIMTIPQSGITQMSKGIYCTNFMIPSSSGYTDCQTLTDVWSGLSINGVSRPNASLEFMIYDDTSWYDIGTNEGLPREYGFSISGIKRDERIKRGDLRKVIVTARKPYTVNQSDIIDGLYYRLYVREGEAEVNVIDWMDVNRAYTHNYFMLDTSWMIPNTYYLDIKLISNRQVSTYKDVMKFNIVNQVEIGCN